MMAVLRAAGWAAAVAVPAAQLARLGLPALLAVCGLAVLVLTLACWVLGSDARCERAAKILRAWRGTPVSAATAPTSARARWWQRWRARS
jgi:hypothetical protein